MRLGVFGGTFNPVHYGHLRAAEEAREILSLDRILFIPSGKPPLKEKDLAGASQRYAMTREAVRSNPHFEVLDIETRGRGKSYTVNTLKKLLDTYQGDLFFLLGIDAFLDIPNWWKPGEIVSLMNFILISRPGARFSNLLSSPYLEGDPAALGRLDRGETSHLSVRLRSGREAELIRVSGINISSSEIRKRIQEGKSIKYLLPEKVESFIISHKLYRVARKNFE